MVNAAVTELGRAFSNSSECLFTFSEAVNDLVICRLSKQSGVAKGGDEVFLLCEKVNKGKQFI